MYKKKLIFVGAILLTICAFGSFIYLKKQIDNLLIRNCDYLEYIPSPPDSFPVYRECPDQLTVKNWIQLKRLFENEQFARLIEKFDSYQEDFQRNILTEYKILMSFEIFANTNIDYKRKILLWQKQFPHHFAPQFALAKYYITKGWKKRGTDFARNTTASQFKGMNEEFAKALPYLYKSIKLNPNLMPAYCELIKIFNASTLGNPKDEDYMIDRAIKQFPWSFIIRKTASVAKRPRWGGSYEEMEEIAQDGMRYLDNNPNMPILYGQIYFDQATYLQDQNKYEEAKAAYLKSLSFGDYFRGYYQIALLEYYDLKNYNNAMTFVNRAIELNRTFFESYYLKAEILHALGKYSEARQELETADILTSQYDSLISKFKQWAANNLAYKASLIRKNNPEKAMLMIQDSFKYDSNCAAAYIQRAIIYTMQGKINKGIEDAVLANQLDPDYKYGVEVLQWIKRRRLELRNE